MDTLATIKELYDLTKGESVYELSTEGGRVMKIEYQIHKFVHPVSCSQLDASLQSLSDQTAKIEALKAEVESKETELEALKSAKEAVVDEPVVAPVEEVVNPE